MCVCVCGRAECLHTPGAVLKILIVSGSPRQIGGIPSEGQDNISILRLISDSRVINIFKEAVSLHSGNNAANYSASRRQNRDGI